MSENLTADRANELTNARPHVSKEFLLAGAAIFTIAIPATGATPPSHRTYKIRHKEASGKWAEAWFVSILTGPDNENDYAYLGMLRTDTGEVRTTAKSCCPDNHFDVALLRRILARVWANDHGAYEAHGYRTYHEGRCGRCGRTLTVPASIESGIGPECASKMSGGAPARKQVTTAPPIRIESKSTEKPTTTKQLEARLVGNDRTDVLSNASAGNQKFLEEWIARSALAS